MFMHTISKYYILLIIIGLCLPLSAQKRTGNYRQKYEDAEVLVNNNLYDVARTYYVEAYRDAKATRQHKKIQNQIKEKIVLMDCYSMYAHLMDQAKQLEALQDIESANKYFADALLYANYENLNIPYFDSLKARSRVMSHTADLCQTLARVESLNNEGQFSSARELFRHIQDSTEILKSSWIHYGFPTAFIQKMDSIAHFLDNDRNTVLSYRETFPEEFKSMDEYLYQLLNQKAHQRPDLIESDIAFVFSLDTNGVIEQSLSGGVDRDFNDAVLEELRRDLHMRQPHRYGFSMPAREELKYHISSTPTDVWVQKTKNEVIVKDDKVKKQYYKDICHELSKAPEGKYCIQIRRNDIAGQTHTSLRIVSAKGGKAKKWLKSL